METPGLGWRDLIIGSKLEGRERGRQRSGRGLRQDGCRGDRGSSGDKWHNGNKRDCGGISQRRSSQLCRFVEQGGHCRFGDNCSFSHDISRCETQSIGRSKETPEQQRDRADYNSWRRLVKRMPMPNDTMTIELLWTGALRILDEGDRNWKQMLPRDLDAENNYGREHIETLMTMVSHAGGCSTFVALAQPFLSVITHPAMLDCLSVDTFVGGLYNFISGSNGKRAVPFFQHLCTNLVNAFCESSVSTTSVETTLITILTALRELLKREQRAAFHDNLPDIVSSFKDIAEVTGIDEGSAGFQIILNGSCELQAMIARATGLLADVEPTSIGGISTTVVKSTYPREIIIPGGRHDNDNVDITKIKILPTESEIRSDHLEFLPSTDSNQPHFLNDPVERHIDTQFRLLRHDIFGELKDALGGLISSITENPAALNNSRLSLGDIRAYIYPKAHISYLSFNQRRGLEAHVSFHQLPALRKKSASDRRKGTDPKLDYSLSSHEHISTIVTKLATRSQSDLELLAQLSRQSIHGALIELPGVVVATFIPILENLQTMQRFRRLPFHQWILPYSSSVSTGPLDIPPPTYARGADFLFPLDSILTKDGDQLSFSPRVRIDDVACLDELEAQTSLDRGQCQALMAALMREFAFIQGPPGTGKSYLGVQLMRVLLACKKKVHLGPVVVVCYTNHALDQFLEHLIEIGVEKIIRIGGQSKSKILEGKNLRVVSQGEAKTNSERYLVARTYEELGRIEQSITEALGSLHATHKGTDWNNLKHHLQSKYPRIYSQFSRFDEDGFEIVGKDPFDVWTQGAIGKPLDDSNTTDEARNTAQNLIYTASQNVHSLLTLERRRLVDFWVQEIQEEKTDQLFELVKDAHEHREFLDKIHDEVDRRVLQTADVIGVTTTGLAKRISVLRHVKCKVIICEEAGEVMESHMISALLPSVEHFIQIGDHQQLRPQINNHGLSLESKQGTPYQLDRSQFERLSVGEPGRHPFPVAQLNVQRRMRPEISTLIRATMYPRLIDHESIKDLPNVVGMRKNVFWLDHENMEEAPNADRHQKSRSNDWEVHMTHALVRHIVRQGVYASSDIAVLTPYTGQLQKLRTKMRNDFEIVLSDRDEETLAKDGFNEDTALSDDNHASTDTRRKPLEKKKLSEFLRIATVDNFQGEESKIIIISLVRSNKEKKVGFLKTTNRINVLLSRAQHGMYLIGNVDTYSNIQMWAQIISMLEATDSIGKSIGLCCPRHVDTALQASEPLDFDKFSPEGGCQLACDRRLIDCGHKCLARCHSDSMHNVFKCPQPYLSSIWCNVPVEKQVPGCNHVIKVSCSQDVSSPSFECPTACATNLPCGHRCPGTCGRCSGKDTILHPTEHQKCTKVCGRRFGTCNHTCKRPCHDGTDCGPCFSPCEVRCSHSRCTLRCHQSCAPCIESCTWSCEHRGDCSMPCAAPCNRLPCNERCPKTLSCGHRCPGICGEVCAEGYCHECHDKIDARVDLLELKSYGEIDVDETPIVVLGCAHFFTAESLDGLVGMSEVYDMDGYGNFSGLKDLSTTLARAIPCCPDCARPIRQFATQRYNRVINRAVIDEMTKRFLTSGKDELKNFEQQIVKLEQELTTSREKIMLSISQARIHLTASLTAAKTAEVVRLLKERHAECRKLEGSIEIFRNNVADKNQPAQKLHEATVHAARKAAAPLAIDMLMANLAIVDNPPALARDRQITMGGQMIHIKTRFVTLDDKFTIEEALLSSSPTRTPIKAPGGSPDLLAGPFFQECTIFIDECNAQNLPKLAAEASLFYASIARSLESFCRSANKGLESAATHVEVAKKLLEDAKEVCKRPFHNAESLRAAVEESMRLMRKQWYEKVTAEEVEAIKAAMVSGSRGLASHSGHWYNCVNGHPFAIGECGMPMELARCPECGAQVGGQNHTAVGGVTRAMDMED
ncbi:hypothetical protein B0O99DRAFT_503550 [Bisporella sp. PMI_857]|nr:hypothetical protein B0O99DRAFT_503550 [Bisporella sp. PMI_857]